MNSGCFGDEFKDILISVNDGGTKLEALKLNLETVEKLGDGVLLTYCKK